MTGAPMVAGRGRELPSAVTALRCEVNIPRNYAIDIARLIAAFGVIIIHCAPYTKAVGFIVSFFLNFCVPFFLLTSVYFFWREINKGSDPTTSLHRRLSRLFVSYAVWTLIYVAA